jgi:hypothetical protein
VELDPNFASAYRALAAYYSNVKLNGCYDVLLERTA